MKRFVINLLLSVAAVVACQPEEIKTDYSITVSGNTKDRPYAGQRIRISVVTNAPSWTYDFGIAESWLTVESKDDKSMMVLLGANSKSEPRSAELVFYAPADTKQDSCVLVLSQAGAPFIAQFSTTSKSDVKVDATDSTYSFAVSTNLGSWGIRQDSGSDWLSVKTTPDSVYFSFAVNTVDAEHTASFLVYAPDETSYQKSQRINFEQGPADITYSLTDLSADGTSNCYVLPHKGPYKFKATVCGNGQTVTGLQAPSALNPTGVKLVWQSQKSMISGLELRDGYVYFTAARLFGNAVIAVTNAQGAIIWSWHIWFPKTAVEGLSCASGDVMMNLNLGAVNNDHTSLGSYGTLYQWGRKDPFPGSPVMKDGTATTLPITVYDYNDQALSIGHTSMTDDSFEHNHISYSIAHPLTCISNNAQYRTPGCRDWIKQSESNAALWGNPNGTEYVAGADVKYQNKGSKTYYDPCPVGWRVPHIETFQSWTKSGSMAWASGDTENLVWGDLGGATTTSVVDYNNDGIYSLKADFFNGWYIWLDKSKGVKSYFPAATRYDGQYAMLMGSMVGLWGNYWTNAASQSDDSGTAQAVAFGIKDYSHKYSISLSPLASGSRADAYSVRCIKEQ